MNVLVIGGAGFIGSHLCEKLVDKEEIKNVFSLDSYLTGKESNHVEGVSYIRGKSHDISNIVNFKIDLIYHLGEYSRVETSFDDEDFVWQNNVVGSRCVFKYAFKNNIKLVYAGSSTKYSMNEDEYIESPYAFYKRINTEFLVNLSSWQKGKYAITYFYNVYGEREIKEGKYATVIAKFLDFKKKGLKLPITAPGTQERNFTHVSDVVEGLILVGLNGNGDGFNIGNEKSISILKLAKLIKSEFYFTPEKSGNRKTSVLDSSKVKNLGWKCKTNLEDYIYEKNKS